MDKVFELYLSPDENWAIMVGKIFLEKSAFLLTDIELDDVASASIYAGMYRDLEGSTNQQVVQLMRDVMEGEVIDIEREIGKFQFLFEARKAALECMLEVTEKIAKDTQRDMIQYYKENYMNMLDYPEYLSKSCEAASYKQKFNYGYIGENATIKGVKTTEQANVLSVSVMENITLEKVVFPEKIGEYTISEIESGAFEGDETIEAIVIPRGIERIGDRAFAGMPNLKSVIIKEGAKEIGVEAFAECPQLKVITLPESLNNIGQKALDSGIMVNSPQNTTINEYVQNNGLLHNRKESVVESIAITKLPAKLDYAAQEELDETGMEIQVNYANGNSEIKYGGWLSYFEEKTIGENKIVVTYQGAETEYFVNVVMGEIEYTISYKDLEGNRISDRIAKKGEVGRVVKESAWK